MEDLLVHIVLLQHIISEEPAGLAPAGNISHPTKGTLSVIGLLGIMILEETPVGIDHQQAVVADALGVVNLVEIETRLPGPLSHQHLLAILLVELHSIFEFGE